MMWWMSMIVMMMMMLMMVASVSDAGWWINRRRRHLHGRHVNGTEFLIVSVHVYSVAQSCVARVALLRIDNHGRQGWGLRARFAGRATRPEETKTSNTVISLEVRLVKHIWTEGRFVRVSCCSCVCVCVSIRFGWSARKIRSKKGWRRTGGTDTEKMWVKLVTDQASLKTDHTAHIAYKNEALNSS